MVDLSQSSVARAMWVFGAGEEEDADALQNQRVQVLQRHVELLLKQAEAREAELRRLRGGVPQASGASSDAQPGEPQAGDASLSEAATFRRSLTHCAADRRCCG